MHEYKNEIAAHLPSIHHPSYMTLIDAAMLYAMIRYHRPATYLEVGSGTSTKIAAAAIEDSDTHTPIISIDPQPRAEVDAICSKVYRCGLEEVDQSLFDSLRPNDILFVDGSHSCFMNSDVTVFFLEILPRLRPRVIICMIYGCQRITPRSGQRTTGMSNTFWAHTYWANRLCKSYSPLTMSAKSLSFGYY